MDEQQVAGTVVSEHPDELRFRPESHWVRRCRHWAADLAHHAGASDSATALVELLTSEVVTNAVRHGPADGEVAVRVRSDGGVLAVEVDDEDPAAPVLGAPGPGSTGGRGVWLVDELALDWGVRTRPEGKSVWFLVDTHPGLPLAG